MTSELQDRDPVEVLGEEFLARRRRGENPKIQQYVDAHRQYADQIRALFPAMLAMEDLKVSKNLSSDRPIRLHVDRLERLGDYRIIREIGHGGMGIVYEAEQQSLRRRVAVKVFPKQAIGDTQQLKRFQREAETAGALHHTNIVPVFGVGHQDGLHYFVMQYLDGVSLDMLIAGLSHLRSDAPCEDCVQFVFDQQFDVKQESMGGEQPRTIEEPLNRDHSVVDLSEADIVDKANQGVRSRAMGKEHWRRIADIGNQVADALQYAHSHGVLHRDIKPSNLILGGDGRVWVTDFGLAVSPQQERLSRSGDVVGTLRYMSPEQLHGTCDRRSDVYALGLTLYELATMRPAFEGESRGSLIRKVSKGSPQPPRALCPEIPRDLETVILKAIARSPESRYRSAGELAEDLRRFCEDRPIRARRIGPAERLCRWSRRNPALAGMSLALAIGAMVSFAAVSWNWRQAINEKKNAETQGARAENNLILALGSMNRLLERFESDWMSHPVESDSVQGDASPRFRFVVSDQSAAILEEALVFYDQFAQQNANSPRLLHDTAKAYRQAGDILQRLGRFPDAEQAYRRSAETLLLRIDPDDPDTELVAETAAVLNRLALVLHDQYRSAKAKQILDQARELLTRSLRRNEGSLSCTYELALTNSNMVQVSWALHQGEESTRRHRLAIMLLDELVDADPLEAKYRLALARAYRNYYPIASVCKERTYSNEIRDASAKILEQLVADFPDVPDYRCELSEMLALIPDKAGLSPQQKRRQNDRAVHLAEHLNREFRAIPRYKTALAKSLSSQATLLRREDPERASEIHERSTGLLRELSSQFPNVPAYHALIADALCEQGITLNRLGNVEEAICVLEEAITEQDAFLLQRPESSYGRKAMSSHLSVLADVLGRAGDEDRATEVGRRADRFWKRRPSIDETIPGS